MTFRTLFTLFISLILSYQVYSFSEPAKAASRNCTSDEKTQANAELLAIQNDSGRFQPIIDRHLPFGVHTNDHTSQGGVDNEVLLLQGGYVMLHDNDLRTALWVSYKLTSDDINGAENQDRVNCFRPDPRLTSDDRAKSSDFDEPIYDQGHLANDADLKDNVVEQINTYVLSNMSPQHCRLNRGIWLSLEHLGRAWAENYETIYITSGAVFDFNKRDKRDKDRSAARMGSRNQKARVGVPSHYYKIFLRKEGNEWHSLAFLLENNNAISGVDWSTVLPKVKTSIKSIEEIEAMTEVVFYPNLSRETLVQSLNGEGWDLSTGKSNFEASC